jgi:hypothetical protein
MHTSFSMQELVLQQTMHLGRCKRVENPICSLSEGAPTTRRRGPRKDLFSNDGVPAPTPDAPDSSRHKRDCPGSRACTIDHSFKQATQLVFKGVLLILTAYGGTTESRCIDHDCLAWGKLPIQLVGRLRCCGQSSCSLPYRIIVDISTHFDSE